MGKTMRELLTRLQNLRDTVEGYGRKFRHVKGASKLAAVRSTDEEERGLNNLRGQCNYNYVCKRIV